MFNSNMIAATNWWAGFSQDDNKISFSRVIAFICHSYYEGTENDPTEVGHALIMEFSGSLENPRMHSNFLGFEYSEERLDTKLHDCESYPGLEPRRIYVSN